MFGKKKQDSLNEDSNVVVDTLPRPEPTPEPPPETSAELFAPPKEKEPETAVVQPEAPPPAAPTTDSELARLRDILFGGQTRSMEKRMTDLELRTEAIRQELVDLIAEKTESLDASASNQLAATRTDLLERLNMKTDAQSQNLRALQQELSDRLEQQGADLTVQIKSVQRDLSGRLDTQQTEQAGQLREVQKELSQRLDTLAADFMSQLRQIEKELGERIDRLSESQSKATHTLQVETRKRDDELRQELVSLAGMLENKKVSRGDLGQMLAELGQRLRSEVD
jgi:DNA anti-recombination protein RmuC